MFAGYLIILTTHVMCDEITRCYNYVNICLRTGEESWRNNRFEAQSLCRRRNAFLPRVTNSDIQNKLREFRSRNGKLGNREFWIDVHTTDINDFHWIDGSSLAGHFTCEFAGIIMNVVIPVCILCNHVLFNPASTVLTVVAIK